MSKLSVLPALSANAERVRLGLVLSSLLLGLLAIIGGLKASG
jgi:hypothetical protein